MQTKPCSPSRQRLLFISSEGAAIEMVIHVCVWIVSLFLILFEQSWSLA